MREAEMDLRPLGIEAIGDVPWGTHFCQFFQTKQDLLDLLVPYFAQGLAHNEYCMWITAEPLGVDDAKAAMRDAVPGFAEYLGSGQIDIIPYTEWYVIDGVFDRDRVLAGWVQRLEAARARGYEGLRLSGNTFWLEPTRWSDFTEYEAAVNWVIGKYRMIALCTYSLDRCGGPEVIDVLEHHQHALVKRGDDWVLIETSEQKRTADAMARLNEALEQRTAEIQAFSRNVSHDLRAPLRAMKGFAHELLVDLEGDLDLEDARYLAGRIDAKVEVMEQLIAAILAFSRAERAHLAKSVLDMDDLVQRTWADVTASHAGPHLELRVRPLPAAEGDPAMVEQVFTNLFENALEATRSRTSPLVEVSAEETDGRCTYHVRDNGVGFDMAYAERIFQPFERLGPGGEGTGLGLPIVRRVVERHGGEAWAEGRPGEGAVVSFTLPAAP